jgi:hypothetical protein
MTISTHPAFRKNDVKPRNGGLLFHHGLQPLQGIGARPQATTCTDFEVGGTLIGLDNLHGVEAVLGDGSGHKHTR